MASHLPEQGDIASEAFEATEKAAKTVREYPLASLLLVGGIVIGAGLIVASMMENDDEADAPQEKSSTPRAVAAATSALGPRGAQALKRIRDAVFGFAIAKTVDTVEDRFPGFREHFDKA